MSTRWSEQELELLRDTSLTLAEVAQQTGRTLAAVEHKSIKQGIDRSFRVGSGLLPGGGKTWTPDELSALDDMSLSLEAVAERTGRSLMAVRIKASSSGVRRYAPWADWELTLLADTSLTAPQVAEQTGRTEDMVRGKARAEGIQREIRSGEDHYRWVGGPSVDSRWRGQGWRQFRLEALERDGYTCQDCRFVSFSGAGLHVHHIIPWRLRQVNELRWLITLCDHCHVKRPEHLWTEIPGHILALSE